MIIPKDIGLDRVATHGPQTLQPIVPQLGRDPTVVKGAREELEGFAIPIKAVVLDREIISDGAIGRCCRHWCGGHKWEKE